MDRHPPHMLALRPVVSRCGVAVAGWRCWHAPTLAPSLLVAEGQFWWSLGRQDGIVGRAKGGGALSLIPKAQNTPDCSRRGPDRWTRLAKASLGTGSQTALKVEGKLAASPLSGSRRKLVLLCVRSPPSCTQMHFHDRLIS